MKRLLLTMLLLAGAVFAFAQNSTAVIREVTGTVELKRGGSADWTAARAGDRIDKATMVSTGFKSFATLAVGNSILTVRPLTRLSLEELINMDTTENVNISLSTGRVRVEVSPPAGQRTNFTVRSPIATASVRGTSFEIDTNTIRVMEGTVSYASAGSPAAYSVSVSAGQESWVDADASAALNPMDAAEINRTLPDLAGQNAGTLSNTGRLAPPVEDGSFMVEVNF